MKIKVNDVNIAILERNSNSILMDNHRHIFVYHDVQIEEGTETTKKVFQKPITKDVKYLVGIEITCYNSKGKFVGVLNEEDSKMFLIFNNFDAMRKNWQDFKEELLAFHLEVIRPVKKEEPQTFAELGAKTFNEQK